MKWRSISIYKQPSLPSFAHHDFDTALSESWLPLHLQEEDRDPHHSSRCSKGWKSDWNISCMVWEEATAALGGIQGQQSTNSFTWPGNEITISVMAHTKALSYNLFPLLCTHSWDWVAWSRQEVRVHLRKPLCYWGTLLWPVFLLSAYRLV